MGQSFGLAPPRTIYSLWLQGRDNAPELVQLCLDRWERLNPEYELRVMEQRDFDEVLRDFPVDPQSLTIQAASDALRARVLAQNGGIWADATLLPVLPLSEWLSDMLGEADFFAFNPPGSDRPIASWFLVCRRQSYIMRRWLRSIEAYWYKERRLIVDSREGDAIPEDPLWEVSLAGGGAKDTCPYFWFHYLFGELLDTEERFRREFATSRDMPSEPAVRVQRLLRETPDATKAEVREVARQAPVQKLDWRQEYPLDVLSGL